MGKIDVLNPTGTFQTTEYKMAHRIDNLENKVLGLLWNRKANGDILLNRISSLLKEKINLSQILMKSKPSASAAAPDDVLNELEAKSDMIIAATGD
jgi:hypothetical protein